jgi:hypothetical protein
MSKELKTLIQTIDQKMYVLHDHIKWIMQNVVDAEQLVEESYFNTKDSFELVIFFRALRDMIEEEL